MYTVPYNSCVALQSCNVGMLLFFWGILSSNGAPKLFSPHFGCILWDMALRQTHMSSNVPGESENYRNYYSRVNGSALKICVNSIAHTILFSVGLINLR